MKRVAWVYNLLGALKQTLLLALDHSALAPFWPCFVAHLITTQRTADSIFGRRTNPFQSAHINQSSCNKGATTPISEQRWMPCRRHRVVKSGDNRFTHPI